MKWIILALVILLMVSGESEIMAKLNADKFYSEVTRLYVVQNPPYVPLPATPEPTVIPGEKTYGEVKTTVGAWEALGTGTNNTVYALARDSAGNIYIGGKFTTAGGNTANRVAKWDGSTWSALGTGMNDDVYTLVFDSLGNLYAGGDFTTADGLTANRVAMWNGSAWSAVGTGMNKIVNALTFDSAGNLYAAGNFTTAGGAAIARVAKWDGATWSALGTGLNYTAFTLVCDSSNNLYAGGIFTTAGGLAANHVAKWNGSAWSAMGSGMGSLTVHGCVYTLKFDASGNLWAGGHAHIPPTLLGPNLAKWNGVDWDSVGGQLENSVVEMAFNNDGHVYVCGGFTQIDGSLTTFFIAKWDSTSWSALGTDLLDDSPERLLWDGAGNLYVVGYFTAAGGTTLNYVARWVEYTVSTGLISTTPDITIPGETPAQPSASQRQLTAEPVIMYCPTDKKIYLCDTKEWRTLNTTSVD